MCYFNSRTCKRTILWSTGSIIGALKIYKTMRRSDFNFDPRHKTAVTYTNRRGEKAYKGSSELKRSQFPGRIMLYCWCFLLILICRNRYMCTGANLMKNQLRIYTPKFASFLVRMLPYFNDCRRKQPLPEAICRCCKPFFPLNPGGFHPQSTSPHAGGHLRAYLQVVLGDVLRWPLAWCPDDWSRVILARIQIVSHSSKLEAPHSKCTVKRGPKWKRMILGKKNGKKWA